MTRNLFTHTAAAGLFILSLFFASCGGGGGNGAVPTSSVQAVACPATGTTDLIMQDFFFSPAAANGAVNTIFKWTNNGPSDHTVTSTAVPNGTFNSGVVGSGASVCFRFTSPGAFSYFCSLHPEMTGIVTVQ